MGMVAYGPFGFYLGVTPARDRSGERAFTIYSREHWLMWRIDEEMTIRGGRLTLPFGLRMPDHTLPSREGLGFSQFSQSYGAELDLSTAAWLVSVAAFAGDFLMEPVGRHERGAVATVVMNLPARAAIGASVLYGNTDFVNRAALGVHARVRGPAGLYALAVVAAEGRFAQVSPASQLEMVGMLRVGWFPGEWVDLYAEAAGRIGERSSFTALRYGLGADVSLLPWVHVVPGVLVEERRGAGPEVQMLAQLHLIY
jgi:hypothetical protein